MMRTVLSSKYAPNFCEMYKYYHLKVSIAMYTMQCTKIVNCTMYLQKTTILKCTMYNLNFHGIV